VSQLESMSNFAYKLLLSFIDNTFIFNKY